MSEQKYFAEGKGNSWAVYHWTGQCVAVSGSRTCPTLVPAETWARDYAAALNVRRA